MTIIEKSAIYLTIAAAAAILTVSFFDYNGFDFQVYYTAGQSLLNGRIDLYAADFASDARLDYRYPPFFLILFLPLWSLPFAAAAVVWNFLNAAIFGAGVFIVRREIRKIVPRFERFNLVLLIVLLAVGKYLIPSLRLGNAHLLTLGLVFAAFYLWRNRQIFSAALLLAAAICFKIFPVLLMPYFVIRRQWRFLILTAICVVVFNLVPAVWFGFSNNANLLAEWSRHVIADTEFHDLNGPANLSLKGQLTRSLSEIDYARRVADKDYPQVNFLSLSNETINLIWIFGAVLIYGGTLILIWRGIGKNNFVAENITDGNEFSMFHEFALMICLMLLIAPRTNDIYLVTMIFPLLVLGILSFAEKSITARIGLVAVIFITIFLPLIPGSQTARWLKVFGADFYAVLILWIALLISLWLGIKEKQEN